MHGVDYVLHAILDFVVDGYLPMVEAIEEEVLAMEHRAIDNFLGREEINRIFTLRRELIRFQRVLGPMGEVASKLARQDLPCIDAETRPYFSDVLDHVRRVQTMVDGLREVLNSVFEFSNLLEQQRTGVITRQLAAWAAILAVPTAIAGIYGMNFRHMPELDTRYGYFVVLAVIVAGLRLALLPLQAGALALKRAAGHGGRAAHEQGRVQLREHRDAAPAARIAGARRHRAGRHPLHAEARRRAGRRLDLLDRQAPHRRPPDHNRLRRARLRPQDDHPARPRAGAGPGDGQARPIRAGAISPKPMRRPISAGRATISRRCRPTWPAS